MPVSIEPVACLGAFPLVRIGAALSEVMKYSTINWGVHV